MIVFALGSMVTFGMVLVAAIVVSTDGPAGNDMPPLGRWPGDRSD